MSRPVQMIGLGTATPAMPIAQGDLLRLALQHNAKTDVQCNRLERIYQGSTVEHRYSALRQLDLLDKQADTDTDADTSDPIASLARFYPNADTHPIPTTRERMARYETHAPALAHAAAAQALAQADTDPSSITDLVTVSCTGFHAPGIDMSLIASLGLSESVSRTHVGFMGCHGALNALRIAHSLAAQSPTRRVLVCCVELCTLHFQYGTDPQDAVANALFGDGAGAALVGSGDTSADNPLPRLADFFSHQLPGTADMMSWRIGDTGFRMRLGARVPSVIEAQLGPAIAAWLSRSGLSVGDIKGWAVHPGGPRVLDAVQSALGLSDASMQASRDVLRCYGNMSSPTVLFIAERLLAASEARPWVMLGFGPGLAIEAMLIR